MSSPAPVALADVRVARAIVRQLRIGELLRALAAVEEWTAEELRHAGDVCRMLAEAAR